jgi:hypothetical protein
VPRPPTFASALDFTPADLAANRDGRLGRPQLIWARIYAGLWFIMGALFLLAMGVAVWAQSNRDGHGTIDIVLPFVLALLVSGFCLVMAFGRIAGMTRHAQVRRLTGPVRAAEKQPFFYAGEERFRGPGRSVTYNSSPFPRLVADHPVGNVYVLKSGRAVSMERVDS